MTIRTATVTHVLQQPGTSAPVPGRKCSVRLNTPAFTSDGTTQKVSTRYVTTDATGAFSVVLEVNDDLDPAGTWYTIQLLPGIILSFIVDAGSAGQTVTLRSLLVDAPSNTQPIQAGVSTAALSSAVDTAVQGVLAGAPAQLDTLNELAAALGDDGNFAANTTAAIAAKLAKGSNLADLASPSTARTNLGLGTAATQATTAFDAAGTSSSAIAQLPGVYGPGGTSGNIGTTQGDSRYTARVGLFSTMTSPAVPSVAGSVVTEGYSQAGRGAATYVYDAAVNSTYVTANPRASFLAADGRGFRLHTKQRPSPFMFGAVGDGVIATQTGTDDAVALQAFAAFVTANDCGTASVDGTFLTSQTITLDASATLNLSGRCTLIAKAGTTGGALLVINNTAALRYDYFNFQGNRTGAVTNYASRGWQVGVAFTGNSSRANGKGIEGDFLAFALVVGKGDGASDNVDHCNFGEVRANDCGSGARYLPASTIYGLTTNWSSPVNAGSGVGQTCTINVDTLPPTYVTDGTWGALGTSPYMIRVCDSAGNMRLHYILGCDRTAGTLSVFPWINPAATPATSDYVYGGGVWLVGHDANTEHASKVEVTRCGTGVTAGGLYGPVMERIIATVCGPAIVLGFSPSAACMGGLLGGYFENNVEDIIYVSRPSSVNSYNWLSKETALNLAKCYALSAPRLAGTFTDDPAFQGFQNFMLASKGRNHRWIKKPYAGETSTVTPTLDRPDMRVDLNGDTFTVNFAPLDLDLHRLTGYNTATVRVVGSGSNGAPTGTVTFNAPAGWTINGGSSAVAFSGLGRATDFVCRFDTVALNFVVTQFTIVPASAVQTVWSKLKTSDTTSVVASLVNDPDLVLTGVPAGDYILQAFLRYDATTTADIAIGWAFTGTGGLSTTYWNARGEVFTGTTNVGSLSFAATSSATSQAAAGAGIGQLMTASPVGRIKVTNTGNFSLRWGQNALDAANATTLYAGAWIRLESVS